MILFVQPYGLSSPGGGSKILRALLDHAPFKWLSLAATADPISAVSFGQEIHVQVRPSFGRLERTRFSHWLGTLDGWASFRLSTNLNRLGKQHRITGVHALAHSCWDTSATFKFAKKNKLPFFLSVHDDPAYCLASHPLRKRLLKGAMKCWREAEARFVISEELGEELCQRWGQREYVIVTDGLTNIEERPRPVQTNQLHVYFMGLVHISYEPNFVALQKALQIISRTEPKLEIRLTLRGCSLQKKSIVFPEILQVLPFGGDPEVQSDLKNADVLYQPLSLESAHRALNAYSLSTKMITYLGSGLPIVFHGPRDSAAGQLLARSRAAFICDVNDPHEIAQTLMQALGLERHQVISSALKLASKQFRLGDIRERFWSAMRSRGMK